MSQEPGLNRRPAIYDTAALPTELSWLGVDILSRSNVFCIHFGLQIFTDINPGKAKNFWMKKLELKSSQFQKIVVSQSLHKKGTYRKKVSMGC